jgi:hypothetical protein
MENEKLATELLREVKASARRWFISFLVILALWFSTIGIFIWYVSLPVEECTVELDNDDGNANYVGNNMNGVINNGECESSQEEEGY